MQIEALTFDFWNTLYKIPREEERSFKRLNEVQALADSFGQYRPDGEILQAIKDTWEYTYRLQRREGYDIGPRGQVEQIVRRLGLELSASQFEELYQMFIGYLRVYPPQLNYGVQEVLPVMAERYRLAVICNTGSTPGAILREIMQKDGIAGYFRERIYSDEVGWAKPNPLIFSHTLHLLEVKPENAAHIGDDPSTDLKGAREAGMMAIWLAPDAETASADCDYHIRALPELLDIF